MNKTLNKVRAAIIVGKFEVKEKLQDFLNKKDNGEKNVVIEMLFMGLGVAVIAAIAAFVTTNWTTISTKMQEVINTTF